MGASRCWPTPSRLRSFLPLFFLRRLQELGHFSDLPCSCALAALPRADRSLSPRVCVSDFFSELGCSAFFARGASTTCISKLAPENAVANSSLRICDCATPVARRVPTPFSLSSAECAAAKERRPHRCGRTF